MNLPVGKSEFIFPSISIAVIGSYLVPYVKEFPFDFFRLLWVKRQQAFFCSWFQLKRASLVRVRKAERLIKGWAMGHLSEASD